MNIDLVSLGSDHYNNFVAPLDEGNANSTAHLATLNVPGNKLFACKLMIPEAVGPGERDRRLYPVPGHEHARTSPRRHLDDAMATGRRPTAVHHCAPACVEEGLIVMWCTEHMPLRSVRARFGGSGERTAATLRLLQHESGKRLAALDHFTGNVDRHDGNYLSLSPTECVAIDNELLFGMRDWRAGAPCFCTENELLKEAMRSAKLGGAPEQKLLANLLSAMVFYGEQHGAQYGEVRPVIERWIRLLYDEVAARNMLSCLDETQHAKLDEYSAWNHRMNLQTLHAATVQGVERGFEGKWCPISFTPDQASPQSFVIGIALQGSMGQSSFRLLSELGKFKCVYGHRMNTANFHWAFEELTQRLAGFVAQSRPLAQWAIPGGSFHLRRAALCRRPGCRQCHDRVVRA